MAWLGCLAGFALLEAGLTRAKNVVNIFAKNMADAVIGILAFFATGYAFAFGSGGSKWLGSGNFFLGGYDEVEECRREMLTALFHDLGCGSKQFFCCPVDEPDGGDPHVLASQMLSPASVDAIADAAILFVRAHLGRGHGLERRRSGAELRRGASYGPFGSFTGLDGLTRPFPF